MNYYKELISFFRSSETEAKNHVVLGNVSEPLEELKKLLAEKNIELMTKSLGGRERRSLMYEIEIATKSIQAIK
tara:strand:- start:131 stop:352 length:222 start_codon:yes stop_codon:yes gene_type:complete